MDPFTVVSIRMAQNWLQLHDIMLWFIVGNAKLNSACTENLLYSPYRPKNGISLFSCIFIFEYGIRKNQKNRRFHPYNSTKIRDGKNSVEKKIKIIVLRFASGLPSSVRTDRIGSEIIVFLFFYRRARMAHG